jgi:hypothetical protein
MYLLLGTLLLQATAVHSVTWQLGVKQPNRPEADVCGIARDYLLPTHTAYLNLELLATVDGTGKVRFQLSKKAPWYQI